MNDEQLIEAGEAARAKRALLDILRLSGGVRSESGELSWQEIVTLVDERLTGRAEGRDAVMRAQARAALQAELRALLGVP